MFRLRRHALLASALLLSGACRDTTAPPDGKLKPESPAMSRFTVTGFAVKSVTSGFFHTCALTSAGKAYCWGANFFGELGDGTNTDSNVPVPVDGGLVFTTLAAGAFHTCGLSDGRAFCWGRATAAGFSDSNTPVEVPGNLTFLSITAGGENPHTCAVTRSGTAYCWGANSTGQLGDGTNSDASEPVAVAGGLSFASLSAGYLQTCGLTKAGQALCWGSNGNGILGNGAADDTNAPVPVSTAQVFTSIATGVYHTCGLTKGGQALCWGRNQWGQLGDGSTTTYSFPVAAAPGMTFTSIAIGVGHTCGLVKGGRAYCWGLNETRQLGTGSSADSVTTPAPVTGGFTFTSLGLGGSSSCGITKDIGTWCWGLNAHGELGNGTNSEFVAAPSPVSKPN